MVPSARRPPVRRTAAARGAALNCLRWPGKGNSDEEIIYDRRVCYLFTGEGSHATLPASRPTAHASPLPDERSQRAARMPPDAHTTLPPTCTRIPRCDSQYQSASTLRRRPTRTHHFAAARKHHASWLIHPLFCQRHAIARSFTRFSASSLRAKSARAQ